MYGGNYTFESSLLNIKMCAPREVLVSVNVWRNINEVIALCFSLLGLLIVSKLDAPWT